jgi:hypothetical protein
MRNPDFTPDLSYLYIVCSGFIHKWRNDTAQDETLNWSYYIQILKLDVQVVAIVRQEYVTVREIQIFGPDLSYTIHRMQCARSPVSNWTTHCATKIKLNKSVQVAFQVFGIEHFYSHKKRNTLCQQHSAAFTSLHIHTSSFIVSLSHTIVQNIQSNE